mgnify:CR=1 FL=1
MSISIEPIAHIYTDFPSKFGIPRQSGIVSALQGRIVLTPAYRNADALRGLDAFSHLWLIWHFSAAAPDSCRWQPTVRPPRLGGNKRMGVFATRSPFRPNRLGLSAVRLSHIDFDTPNGPIIHVLGADLMSGTPIFDIKPYIAFADSIADAKSGFVDEVDFQQLEVDFPPHLQQLLPNNLATTLTDVLRNNPRPQYQTDANRVYGMPFAGFDVKFRINGDKLTVVDLVRI